MSENTEHAYLAFVKDVTSDGRTITKGIDELRATSAALPRMAAILAASCVLHAIEHGNVTPCNRMLDALPHGWKVNALRSWFEVKGPLRWNDKAERYGLDSEQRKRLLSRIATKDARLKLCSELMSHPFTEYKPASVSKPFNLQEQLARVIKAAGKADQNDPRNVGLDKLEDLRSFVVEAFTFDKVTVTMSEDEQADSIDHEIAQLTGSEDTKKAA